MKGYFSSAILMTLGLTGFCQTFDDYMYQTKTNFAGNDYKGAIFFYTKAIEVNPRDTAAYCGRARAEVELDDYGGAIEDYTKCPR
jgi:tetratricopeptide (TPR) repeat protein